MERRGHAAQGVIEIGSLLEDVAEALRKDKLPEPLREARASPEWSTLVDHYEPSARRIQAVKQLAEDLAQWATPAHD